MDIIRVPALFLVFEGPFVAFLCLSAAVIYLSWAFEQNSKKMLLRSANLAVVSTLFLMLPLAVVAFFFIGVDAGSRIWSGITSFSIALNIYVRIMLFANPDWRRFI